MAGAFHKAVENNGEIFVDCHSVISFRLDNDFRVDITLDKSVRMTNFKSNISVALGKMDDENLLSVEHPTGKLYRHWEDFNIVFPTKSGILFVRESPDFTCFTSKGVQVYKLSAAGVNTCICEFLPLEGAISVPVLLKGCRAGVEYFGDALRVAKDVQFSKDEVGLRSWEINGITVLEKYPLIRVIRDTDEVEMNMNNGCVSIQSGNLYYTSSMYGKNLGHVNIKRKCSNLRQIYRTYNNLQIKGFGKATGLDHNEQIFVEHPGGKTAGKLFG